MASLQGSETLPEALYRISRPPLSRNVHPRSEGARRGCSTEKEHDMPKISVQVNLITCKKCKQGYNNWFTHVCRIPFNELAARSIRSGSKPAKRAR